MKRAQWRTIEKDYCHKYREVHVYKTASLSKETL